MALTAYDNPLDSTSTSSGTQPFTGGPGYTPMPAQTGKNGNPFTDVLDHVSAFNDAMNPQSAPIPSGTGFGGPMPVSAFSTSNPNAGTGSDPLTPGGTPTTPVTPTPSTPASDPRTRAVAPPQGGTTKWSAANPMPKPSDEEMRNSETAANWYRSFAWQNPAFANITAADVEAYRAYPQGMSIDQWYLAGHRAGDPVPQGGDPNGGYVAPRIEPHVDPNTGIVTYPGQAPPAATTTPTQPPAAPPGTVPPPPVTGDPSAKPPGGGFIGPPIGTAPPAGTQPPATPPPDIQSLIDMFQKEAGTGNGPDVESMLNPMFARQRQKLDETLRASAALTPGRLESGGFGMNEGQALSDLSGVQSGKLADALQQEHLAKMQQNTALITLGTTAGMQKYVADLNADLTKFQVNTNADLAKWINSADNTLKKYGIDTGDVLARYQSELALKGQMYSADKGVDAAALQAAAAHAAAAASAAASQANAKLQYNLGMQGLNVDREKNIGQFILGLLGIGNMDLNSLNGILNGILPGTVATKP